MRLLTIFRAYVKARDEHESAGDKMTYYDFNGARFDQLSALWHRRRRQMLKFGYRLLDDLAKVNLDAEVKANNIGEAMTTEGGENVRRTREA